MTEDSNPFDDAPIVYGYSRRQATEDGTLVDLSEWAKGLGFTAPVACTRAVWDKYLVPDPSLRGLGQSERGRAHDMLFMLRASAAQAGENLAAERLEFQTVFLMPAGQEGVRLLAVCGPGDQTEPVVTIMRPGED